MSLAGGRRICVIGAGISGLVTTKRLLAAGHDVVALERLPEIGGVWAASRSYPGLRTQSPRDCYAFTDFPMPRDYPEHPSAAQMRAYLSAYVERFGLGPRLRLAREVVSLEERPDGRQGWRVRSRPAGGEREVGGEGEAGGEAGGGEAGEDFDFVVVCNGVFSEPRLPALPGREAFEAAGGLVRHSSAFPDAAPAVGKRAVVVGFGKSAIDLAYEVSRVAAHCTLLYRERLWKLPWRFYGLIPSKYFLLSRYSEFWIDDRRGLVRFLSRRLPFVVRGYWRGAERAIGLSFGRAWRSLRPEGSLHGALGPALGFAPLDNFRRVGRREIDMRQGRIARLSAGALELSDGARLPADVVVFATGFHQGAAFLGERQAASLLDGAGNWNLWRHILPLDLPGLALNGYNSSIASQLTSEVAAEWIARYLAGSVVLPPRQAMERELAEEHDWRNANFPRRGGRGEFVQLTFDYLDQLMRDMGLPPGRRGLVPFLRAFRPINPQDFRAINQAVAGERAPAAAPRISQPAA